MATVYVSVGSNVEPEDNIRQGLDILRKHFGELALSPTYYTEAVGFEGDAFLNLALSFETDEPAEAVSTTLDEIENQCGRIRGEARFGPRTLDLDLLLYDDLVMPELKIPRDEILTYAFVLKPLADLVPEHTHPVEKQTYSALWEALSRKVDDLEISNVQF